MVIDTAAVRKHLTGADLRTLFIQELGWDKHDGATVSVPVDAGAFELTPVAQKRGVQVYECSALEGGTIPDRPTRQHIERQLRKMAHEHLLVFLNGKRSEQLWQWVAREPGRPAALREYRYSTSQHLDGLIQKLDGIAIPISEEETMSVTLVTQRLKDQFDKDKVTKKFYERFKAEHGAFLKAIKGLKDDNAREWYASVMLNRLMFVYFIQKKGFLDKDTDYLRKRMTRLQQTRKDKFHSFYRYFLLRLFHEGLGQQERTSELEALIGDVPYLNGGLFDVHELESANHNIQIPDDAFAALFDFFDAFEWHLDQRPLRANNEINPDVLGYIFEKYINQKQMGAYYTKEDITGYISQSTVIPYLFDAAKKDCEIAFTVDSALWRLLREDPDRYIYDAVLKGVDEPLPDDIGAGIDNVGKRTTWNKPAPAEFALPTETWREHLARRSSCFELRAKLRAGEVTSINDLVTYNLDVRQFAQDVIEQAEGPELVRAFFTAIERITVLDPAVGSGAFLFAALNVLKPLHDACLDRMQAFIDDAAQTMEDEPKRYMDFREVLARVEKHENREYFILKSIVINNLYGVDIMEEAVEICKLRLFLKLVAQLDDPKHIEPLPDMDFNIRAGNTLVGFESMDAVRAAVTQTREGQQRLLLPSDKEMLERIERSAAFADAAFQEFHHKQTEASVKGIALAASKASVRKWLAELRDDLDEVLAGQYGSNTNVAAYESWRATHQPFHWVVEFYGIVKSGGFNVVIGNPPYVELNALTKYRVPESYSCIGSGNLYALFIERGTSLRPDWGKLGFIVPVSSISTDRYESLQELLGSFDSHYSSFDDRPSRLFEGLEHVRLTIHLLGERTAQPERHSTRYNKWYSDERPALFQSLRYAPASSTLVTGSLPKLSSTLEGQVLARLAARSPLRSSYGGSAAGAHKTFYSRKVGYFLQVVDFTPQVRDGKGALRPPSEFKELRFKSSSAAAIALCALNSNLFYWFITVFSDCRHVNKREVDAFPLGVELIDETTTKVLAGRGRELMESLQETSEHRKMRFKHDTLTVQCLFPSRSKSVIDEIDNTLGQSIGLTREELDFIINYDIKYRMGAGADEDSD